MSETGTQKFDAALAVLIRVISAGLVFALQVLLARLMPAESYGGFVTLWTWMLALGSFAALGFAESSVRFLPRYQLRQRQAALRNYWQFGLRMVLAVSLLMTTLACAVAFLLGVTDGPGLMILLVALGLPFLAIEYFLEGVARSFGWFRLAAVPVYIGRPLLIGGVAVLVAGLGVPLSLPVVGATVIGSMAAISIGLALVMAARIRRLVPVGVAASRRQQGLWLKASLPLLLLSGLEDLTGYADILLLSLLARPEEVGIYFAAARCLALAGFVAYAMTLVAGRRFALDLATGSRQELQRNILHSTRVTLWATIGAVAAALVAGPWLLAAFGPIYGSGLPVLWVLGAGLIVRALAGQAGEVLIVTGRQREGLWVGVGGLVVTTALGLLLIPPFGMIGAAWAGAAGMAVRSLGLILVLKQRENLRIAAFGFPRFSLA